MNNTFPHHQFFPRTLPGSYEERFNIAQTKFDQIDAILGPMMQYRDESGASLAEAFSRRNNQILLGAELGINDLIGLAEDMYRLGTLN